MTEIRMKKHMSDSDWTKLALSLEESEGPFKIIFDNAKGGFVDEGFFKAIEIIRQKRQNITAYASVRVKSAAAIAYACCGHRVATPETEFMLHAPGRLHFIWGARQRGK